MFGNFDNDALTDALWADGSTRRLSAGASGSWVERLDQSLRAASVRVGDFNADGTDDVFWIANGTWHVWYPALNMVRRDQTIPNRSRASA